MPDCPGLTHNDGKLVITYNQQKWIKHVTLIDFSDIINRLN